MSKRLVVAFLLVFAFAYFILPGRAFAEPPTGPVLTITKSHTGNFTVGTNGTYTLTVTNAGTDTTAAISVTDTLPTGLTFITGTGTGWSCSASGQMVTCTKASLAGGGSSSQLTLTVSVGVAAVPSITNTASVSGGGTGATGGTSNSDATTVKMTVKSGPAVYISTFTGQQILVVDGAVGTTVAIHTASIANSFTPEDIVVGPDKRIYICDPNQNKIYRVRQDDTGFETIYSQNSNSSLPAFPEGPSFNGSVLYFNTHFFQGEGSNGGVWKITGATGTVPSGGFTPTQVFDRSTAGEGTAFGTAGTTSGKLLAVERSSNQVLRCDPSSCSPTTLIPPSPCGGEEQPPCRLDSPIGIAVRKSDGHIFVANAGSTLQNINHFNSSGVFQETYASFSGNDHPFFLEFDALDRLYVVTADLTGAGGKVWRIDPPGGETNLVFLVALSTSIGGVLSDEAVGLGLAPNAAITQTYTSTVKTNRYNFGTDQVNITFPGVSTTFALTVFREEVPEALLGLQLATNFANIPCFGYDSDPGTCVGYEEGVGPTLDPLPPADFTGPVDYQVFYTPPAGATTGAPVLAHALDNNLQTPVDQYDENELKGFTLATSVGPPDPDGMDGSSSGGLSRHVALNTPLKQTGTTFCPQPPVAMDGLTFGKPQTIAIKFLIAASGGSCAAGPFVTSPMPMSQLWLFNPATSTFITPTASGNSSIPNAFHFDPSSGMSIFNLSTKDLPAPATYIFTITSDSVSAHFSFFLLTP